MAGNGLADDTAAIQALLTATPAGGSVFLPTANYRLDGSLTVRPGVMLEGTYRPPGGGSGTTFLVYGGRGQSAGAGAVVLMPGGHLRGIRFVYRRRTPASR